MRKLDGVMIFPEVMPSILCTKNAPMPPTKSEAYWIEALIYEENGTISISHPAFKLKGVSMMANYLIDIRAWIETGRKQNLLIHCFEQIIMRNHGMFESCNHLKETFDNYTKLQRLADIKDKCVCFEHMKERLGLPEKIWAQYQYEEEEEYNFI